MTAEVDVSTGRVAVASVGINARGGVRSVARADRGRAHDLPARRRRRGPGAARRHGARGPGRDLRRHVVLQGAAQATGRARRGRPRSRSRRRSIPLITAGPSVATVLSHERGADRRGASEPPGGQRSGRDVRRRRACRRLGGPRRPWRASRPSRPGAGEPWERPGERHAPSARPRRHHRRRRRDPDDPPGDRGRCADGVPGVGADRVRGRHGRDRGSRGDGGLQLAGGQGGRGLSRWRWRWPYPRLRRELGPCAAPDRPTDSGGSTCRIMPVFALRQRTTTHGPRQTRSQTSHARPRRRRRRGGRAGARVRRHRVLGLPVRAGAREPHPARRRASQGWMSAA